MTYPSNSRSSCFKELAFGATDPHRELGTDPATAGLEVQSLPLCHAIKYLMINDRSDENSTSKIRRNSRIRKIYLSILLFAVSHTHSLFLSRTLSLSFSLTHSLSFSLADSLSLLLFLTFTLSHSLAWVNVWVCANVHVWASGWVLALYLSNQFMRVLTS